MIDHQKISFVLLSHFSLIQNFSNSAKSVLHQTLIALLVHVGVVTQLLFNACHVHVEYVLNWKVLCIASLKSSQSLSDVQHLYMSLLHDKQHHIALTDRLLDELAVQKALPASQSSHEHLPLQQ